MNSLNIFLVVLIIITSILISLTIHELGHFLFAKLFKVNIKEFSIGFGPAIWSKFTKKNMIRVSIRLLPIGAYVLMDSMSLRKSYIDMPNDPKYTFYLRPKPYKTFLLDEVKWWKRLIIMLGGIFFNILAFAIFWGLWTAINPNAFLQLNTFIQNFFTDIGKSIVLYQLWPQNLGGGSLPPSSNFVPTADFLLRYIISINLGMGLLNLVPIPPLDGWKILQVLVEKSFKKTIPEKIQLIFSLFGAILILWITIGSIVNTIV